MIRNGSTVQGLHLRTSYSLIRLSMEEVVLFGTYGLITRIRGRTQRLSVTSICSILSLNYSIPKSENSDTHSQKFNLIFVYIAE